ncbi:hypothetical protein PPL_02625 [Heterostelium album PN500]|uniref:Ankyrin repeat-containing protein n=1 Tax=Heterostelium pallidum (strain ATCC 26659 / Pp 5 / PN500) TaxID=670386 RepID=D3B2L1_HETP5|nr:hypothetical protein PPL_02625 [Heterostelium album PN500]EFA83559.1 hypothetical protein PPL_02625 [Heterostelium album PN500]|eukprot:XP_020435676.1 hypothetical protein PPL_02625 [Heterostelium album PN500]
MNREKRDRNYLFKLILNNLVVRINVFKFIPDIHLHLNYRTFNYEQLCKRSKLLVEYGYLELLEKQHNPFECRMSDITYFLSLSRLAAKKGRIPVIEYLSKMSGSFFYGDEVKYAAYANQWEAVRYLLLNRLDQFTDVRRSLLAKIAQLESGGDVSSDLTMEIADLLLNRSKSLLFSAKELISAINYAIANGNLKLIEMIYKSKQQLLDRPDNNPWKSLDDGNDHINLLDSAIKNGQLAIFNWLLTVRKEQPNLEVSLMVATSNGKFDMVEYILSKYSDTAVSVPKNIIKMAAQYNRLDLIQKYYNNELARNAINNAVEAGNTEVVRYLRVEKKQVASAGSLLVAIKKGHLATVQFLHENHCDVFSKMAMDTAAQYGHLNIVRFLHENRREGCTIKALSLAAGNGEIEVIHYLNKHYRSMKFTESIDKAAGNGWLETVVYLYETRGEKPTSLAMGDAVKNGHYQVVKYLHTIRKEKSYVNQLSWAITENYFNIVKFIVESSPDGDWNHWYKTLVSSATRQSDVDILEYMENECYLKKNMPLPSYVMECDYIVKSVGNVELINYLLGDHTYQQDRIESKALYPEDKEVPDYQGNLFDQTIKYRLLLVMQYMLDTNNNGNGKAVQVTSSTLNCAVEHSTELYEYLRDNYLQDKSIKLTQEVVDSAIKSKNLSLLDYLKETHPHLDYSKQQTTTPKVSVVDQNQNTLTTTTTINNNNNNNNNSNNINEEEIADNWENL